MVRSSLVILGMRLSISFKSISVRLLNLCISQFVLATNDLILRSVVCGAQTKVEVNVYNLR